MKKRFLALLTAVLLVATAVGTMVLTGCGGKDDDKKENLTDKPLEGSVLADFTKDETDAVFASDGWTNGSVFNTWWTADNVNFGKDSMKLTIKDNPDGSAENNNGFFGGEARTYQYFGYGDYEVSMKPAKKAGTASTFFTCTGNYDTDENGNPNPWDEIDIEFLGQDTTKVQFNYYVNGQGGHEYMYDLGFDASEDFHRYGFRWAKDYIVWFVDGKPVHKVTADEENPIPTTAGRILMNYWCGTPEAEGWMGKYQNPGSEGAEYQWIKTSAVPKGEIPEKPEIEEFEGDWTKIDAITPEFSSSNNNGLEQPPYALTADGTSVNVKYTSAGNYDNIAAPIADASAETNWLHMTIRNNSSDYTPKLRINVRNATSNINSFAFGNGKLLTTTTEGTFLEPKPGETVEVEIKFVGEAVSLEIMLDSMQANMKECKGDVTIGDIKFAKQGDIVIPEEPEVPESNNNGVMINNKKVIFNVDPMLYVINTDVETNSMNVKYSNLPGGSYKNLSADVSEIAQTKNKFTAKIVNNGSETVTLRVDMLAGETICNLSAALDGKVVSHPSNEGATFTVKAGKTSVFEIVYNTAKGPTQLLFMVDTSIYSDGAAGITHSGDVTFSKMAFSGDGSVEEPETPEVPEGENIQLAFKTEHAYTIDKQDAADTVNVSYNNLKGGSYANITSEIATLAAGKNTFSLKIKNNGAEAVNVRVDIKATNMVDTSSKNDGAPSQTDICNISATATKGIPSTDLKYGGTMITVAAGEETTLIITYDGKGDFGAVQQLLVYFDSSIYQDSKTYSGNVTLSEFRFTSAQK